MVFGYIVSGVVVIYVLLGIRFVRPLERGLIETFGRYSKFAQPGFNYIFLGFQKIVTVNITQMMVNVEKQEIITKDKLNASVDAQIYFKIKPVEESVKNAVYEVNDVKYQIVNLARTTLRNIIGTMNLTEANSERSKINKELISTLQEETKSWGIDVVKAELKEINPPEEVQNTMNKVVIAENEKIANKDFAEAAEIKADGLRRAAIKEAEGKKQAKILEAQGQQEAQISVAKGEAEAIKLVNESADNYFKGNAQTLKKLQTVENSLMNNAKIIVPTDTELINVIGELAGVPIATGTKESKKR